MLLREMLKITQQKRNDLLYREEILALKESNSAPSMSDIKAELSGILKKDPELVAIKKIKGKFGSREFIIEASSYDNAEIMKKIEPKIKAKKTDGTPENKDAKTGEKK